MAKYGLRKNIGGKNYAQKKGSYAATQEGCCCGPSCTLAWKALPCHAGECLGEVCNCPACYPTEPIYVCTDALCGCDGSPVGTIILAEYSNVPGVKWCFTIDASKTYVVADLPGDATVVGVDPFCVECMTSCADARCPGPRGRFLRPKPCNPLPTRQCAWVCAQNVDACKVKSINAEDAGDPTTACCNFITGPADEQYFSNCPDQYDNWLGPGSQNCCDCEPGCGGIETFNQDSGSDPSCSYICPTINPDPTDCCCNGPIYAIASGSYLLEYADMGGTGRYSVTCNCVKSATESVCHCRSIDQNGNTVDLDYGFDPGCRGESVNLGFFIPITWQCYKSCDVSFQQSRTFTGSASWSCAYMSRNTVETITYVPGTYSVRKETITGSIEYQNPVEDRCKPTCSSLPRGGKGGSGGRSFLSYSGRPSGSFF